MRISRATQLMYRWAWALLALGLTACTVVRPASPTPPVTPSTLTATPPLAVTHAASPTLIQADTATVPPETDIADSTVSPGTPGSTTVAPTPSRPPVIVHTNTPFPLSIVTFTITPAEIRPGESVTLTWEVIAEQAIIYTLDPQGRLSMPWWPVPPSGTMVVTTSALLRNQVSFVLFATLGSATVQAGVTASILCPDVWFFPNPPSSCPGSPPHTTVMQAEHFEHGLMLWTQWNDFIYILYADGLSPAWEARPNAWFPPMPEDDPSLVPPEGLYQPVRGFGVAWRDEQATPGFRVRDRLGWATDQEFGVSGAAFQCDSAPKYVTCYLSGPGGAVYVLKPERSGWFIWAP